MVSMIRASNKEVRRYEEQERCEGHTHNIIDLPATPYRGLKHSLTAPKPLSKEPPPYKYNHYKAHPCKWPILL